MLQSVGAQRVGHDRGAELAHVVGAEWVSGDLER